MMKFSLLIFLLFNVWRLCPAVQLLPKMGYFIVVQQLECVANSDYISKAICEVSTPRNRSINADLVLLQDFKLLMGTMKVSIPNPKKKVFQKIFDVTFEVCKLLREGKRKALIDILQSLTHMENKALQCPINQGHYQVRNVTIVESLPQILSESPFLLNFNWFLSRETPVINITVLGHLYDIGKDRNRKKKHL